MIDWSHPGRPANVRCQRIVGNQGWRVAFRGVARIDIEISAYDILNSPVTPHGCPMPSRGSGVARAISRDTDRAGVRIGGDRERNEVAHARSVARA